MAISSMNKTALKELRENLKTYKNFLPSLDLKRQKLLWQRREEEHSLLQLEKRIEQDEEEMNDLFALAGSSNGEWVNLLTLKDVELSAENIVGVGLPKLESLDFEKKDALTLGQPFWTPLLLSRLESHLEMLIERNVRRVRVERLIQAVRKVTQRVNLFEKVLIPQAKEQIRRIQIHLADMERAAVVRSKFVKSQRERMMEASS